MTGCRRYKPFDFHRECKGMKYQNLQKLLDSVEPQLREQGSVACFTDGLAHSLDGGSPRRRNVVADGAPRMVHRGGRYFKRDAAGTVRKTQASVVRTNCMDCLDRTNVVQSMLARRFLTDQLVEGGVFAAGETINNHASFERMFRNGKDAVTRVFVRGRFPRTCHLFLKGRASAVAHGTPAPTRAMDARHRSVGRQCRRGQLALLGDRGTQDGLYAVRARPTARRALSPSEGTDRWPDVSACAGARRARPPLRRTGKRTSQGAIQDGVNSAVRYIRNNFMDGYRQDALDLLLGNYRVQEGETSRFATSQSLNDSVRVRTVSTEGRCRRHSVGSARGAQRAPRGHAPPPSPGSSVRRLSPADAPPGRTEPGHADRQHDPACAYGRSIRGRGRVGLCCGGG